MSSGFKMTITLEYSKIFNDSPSIDSLMSGISRKTFLNVASFFLGFSPTKSEFNDNRKFIEMFFQKKNHHFAHDVFKRIEQFEKRIGKEVLIPNHLTSLCLFEYAFENLDETESQTDEESEISIFKAYLLINEENNTKAQMAFDSTKELSPYMKLSAIGLAMTFGHSDLINYNPKEIMITQIIKSIFLFEFLEGNEKTKPLLNSFLEYFKCQTWKDYLIKILPFSFACIDKKKEAHVDIVFDKDDKYQSNIDFISKLALADDDSLLDYDFTSLRSNPIYRVNDTTYRVIYDLFVFEMLHKGLYFKLSQINNSLESSIKVKDFRGFYCDEFSENYLFYSTIEKMYGSRYKKLSGQQMKDLGVVAEPDYYIRNGNKIFLFESKDVLVRADVKSSYDYIKLEESFREKFYFIEKDSGKIVNKAVLQLINNIRRVLDQSFNFDTNYKSDNAVIYPILITHHHQYDVAGLNNIINMWFKDELEKLYSEGINIRNVKPITLINIDDLIFHHDQFYEKKILLENAIDCYIDYVTMDTKRKYKNEEHARMYSERTLIPFSMFFTNYVAKESIIKGPNMLTEKGFQIFK